MPDEAFQKLEELPENTLKNFYQNLIKKKCKAFKEIDFHVLDANNDCNNPEYTTIWLKKFSYDVFGTFNPFKLPREEFRRLIEEEEARMKSQQKEQ